MWTLFVIILLGFVGFAVVRRRQRLLQTKANIHVFEQRLEELTTTVRELVDKMSPSNTLEEIEAPRASEDIHIGYTVHWLTNAEDPDSVLQSLIRHGRWNESAAVWTFLESRIDRGPAWFLVAQSLEGAKFSDESLSYHPSKSQILALQP